MTGKTFLKAVTNGQGDVVQVLLAMLDEIRADYCVIDGLAVNAYPEPVVSLDLDLVVAADRIDAVRAAAETKGMKAETFAHSVNLTAPGSDLRIQLQTDGRYQEFVPRAHVRPVLGYQMKVADIRDVLRGKVWAWSDSSRRPSKRQKDLADILRLIETHPQLKNSLPAEVLSKLD